MPTHRNSSTIGRLLALLMLAVLLAACGPGAATLTPLPVSTVTAAPATATIVPIATNTTAPVATSTIAPVAPTATTAAAPTNTTAPTVAATATTAPAQPTATVATTPTTGTGETGNERIIYLDADGTTIRSISPQGGEPQTVYNIARSGNETVRDFTVSPTGEYMLYGLATSIGQFAYKYVLVHVGTPTTISVSLTSPRWSPDGTRFAGQTVNGTGDAYAEIFVYDMTRSNGGLLNVSGLPAWYPDGRSLVYTWENNVYSYDLTTKAQQQLTDLPNDDNNSWWVNSANVLPDSSGIIFFGGAKLVNGENMIGPHGEGQQWWLIGRDGGEPQPWLPAEQFASAYNASRQSGRVAYISSSWAGATCSSQQAVAVAEIANPEAGVVQSPRTMMNEAGDQTTVVNGISLSPTGTELAYSLEPFACSGDGPQSAGTATIYIWDIAAGADVSTARKLVKGLYPQWVAGQ